jgi:hypothetical protein
MVCVGGDYGLLHVGVCIGCDCCVFEVTVVCWRSFYMRCWWL